MKFELLSIEESITTRFAANVLRGECPGQGGFSFLGMVPLAVDSLQRPPVMHLYWLQLTDPG